VQLAQTTLQKSKSTGGHKISYAALDGSPSPFIVAVSGQHITGAGSSLLDFTQGARPSIPAY
jgi:hypothetical protein